MSEASLEQFESEVLAVREMVDSEGWKIFVRDQSRMLAELRMSAWNNIDSLEKLHHLRGFLAATEAVVNLEHLLEVQEKQIEAQKANDADPV